MKKALFIFFAATMFFACKKDKNNGPSSADFYFIADVRSTTIKFEQTPTNDIGMVSSTGGSIGSPNCVLDYGTSIGPFDLDSPYLGVFFPGLFDGDCADEGTVFPTLFPVGAYPYGKVEVEYFDGMELWSSAKGVQPAGVTFNVSESEQVDTVFGPSMTVSGTVSCTLFNDLGESKKLESGSFKLNFTPNF